MILYEEVKLPQHVSYTDKHVLACGLHQARQKLKEKHIGVAV